MMNIDAAILMSAIGTLAACVGYLWKEIRKETTGRTQELQDRLKATRMDLDACLVRERDLLAKVKQDD